MCNSERILARNAPLGIIAKSSAPPVSEKMQSNRRERYKYQSIAAKVMRFDALEKFKKSDEIHVSKLHRVCGCSWSALADNVDLMRSKKHGTGHIKNVMTCGSVWVCPICTAKIQERRRVEIAKAMTDWYESGGKVMMVTLTAPHYNNQSLKDLRSMQAESLKELRKSSGSYSRMLKKNGMIGLIRSLEITVSQKNGWHLHTHELWFVDKNADAKQIKQRTLERWEVACIRSGLLNPDDSKQVSAFRKRSVDLKDSASCSDYLAKMDDSKHWGADREVAKSSTKAGKKSGFHPFGLLAEIANDTDKKAWATAKFIEYGNDMKGARQLFWSHKLKAKFGIDEKTDEEVSAEETDVLVMVKSIHKRTWYEIAKVDARSTLLEMIELNDLRALDLFLSGFEKLKNRNSS